MTMSIKEKTESEEIEWSPEDEIQLFFALDGLKPVGINKYFFMACIADRLSKALNREVSTEAIWSHLKTMYNLEALDELEPLPFPNDEKEFSLPDDFSSLISKKRQDVVPSGVTQTSGDSKAPSRESSGDKKVELPKRAVKRTRGSASLESNSSPSTTPPPVATKRRRI